MFFSKSSRIQANPNRNTNYRRNNDTLWPPGATGIEEMLRREPYEIILALKSPRFNAYLDSSTLDKEILVGLVNLVRRAFESHSFGQRLESLTERIVRSNFFSKHVYKHLELHNPSFIQSVIRLCVSLVRASPFIVDFIGFMKDRLGYIIYVDIKSEPLQQEFKVLDELAKLTAEKNERFNRNKTFQNVDSDEELEPPNDFTRMSIVPTMKDLFYNQDTFLRKNVTNGAYKSVTHYLDVQFRLVREDFMQPLRQGVRKLRKIVKEEKEQNEQFRRTNQLSHEAVDKIKSIDSVKAYFDVQMQECLATDLGLVYVMRLNSSSVSWDYSKHLIYGSLVCLSSDHFQHKCLVGSICVQDNKKLKNGEIYLLFDESHYCPELNAKYIMLETAAFFEAYKHVLEALASFGKQDENSFPFKENLVFAENSNLPIPKYLKHASVDFEPLVQKGIVQKCLIENDSDWPTHDQLGFDESQYAAFRLALTKKLALIQGPPGTGKTFIGVKIVQFLIHNKHLWWGQSIRRNPFMHYDEDLYEDWNEDWPDYLDDQNNRPILMICYTNHALDQFLQDCVKKCNLSYGVVRVGGRCNSESLKRFLLSNVKSRMRQTKSESVIYSSIRTLKQEIAAAQEKINEINQCIEMANSGQILLNFKTLAKYIELDKLREISQQPITYWGNDPDLCNDLKLIEWLRVLDTDLYNESLLDWNNNNRESYEAQDRVNLERERELNTEEEYNYIESVREKQKKARQASGHELGFECYLDIASIVKWKENLHKKQTGEWRVVGKSKALNANLITKKVRHYLENARQGVYDDQVDYNLQSRYRAYAKCLTEFIKEKELFRKTWMEEFQINTRELRELKQHEDALVMKSAKILAMTTTGASRYHSILKDIRPKIVIVEEAAEVFEAHIVSALSEDCEHLILIGDHVQLKPNPSVYRLAKDYRLDVSLFERLINNNIDRVMLSCQHRMRPEISVLMKHFYDQPILDHASVKLFEPIIGLDKSIFFMNHSNQEKRLDDGTAKINQFEAEFLVKLSEYLVKQKYEPSQITIMSMYLGQMTEIRKHLSGFAHLNGIIVTTVDNYQGEENDIILLSLVRSNDQDRIGFLEVTNRCCVALSRARKGFYCIGNFDFICQSKPGFKWLEIVNSLKETNSYGSSLALTCGTHKENNIEAVHPSDFDKREDGGCQLPCNARLECGHACPLKCHTFDHRNFKCMKYCKKLMKCGHECNQICSHLDQCELICQARVEKTVPECDHTIKIACDTLPERKYCNNPCQRTLECGHSCTKMCFEKCEPCLTPRSVQSTCANHPKLINVDCSQKEWEYGSKCEQQCKQELDCGHICKGSCQECHNGRIHVSCRVKCQRVLFCGHECQQLCSDECGTCYKQCQNKCVHSECKKKCYQPCTRCMEPCAYKCSHSKCTKLCWEPCDKKPCDQPCPNIIKCGHPCIGLCGEPCPPFCRQCNEAEVTEVFFGTEDDPEAKFVYLSDCKHVIEVTGMDEWMKSRFDNQHESFQSNNSIKLPECPKCKTPIMSCLRYSKYIKQQLNDIEQIKLRHIGDEKKNDELIDNLMRDIKRFNNNLDMTRRYNLKSSRAIHVDPSQPFNSVTDYRILRYNTVVMLINVWSIFKRWYSIRKNISSNDIKVEAKLHIKYEAKRLLSFILDNNNQEYIRLKPLCSMQWKQIQTDLERVEALLQFYKFVLMSSSPSRNRKDPVKVGEYIKQIEELLVHKTHVYVNDVKAQVEEALSQLRELLGSTVTPEEKVMIVQAMGFKQGHWFKCPNGHIYCIGECGGAMEKSKCPDCKATIGGTQHTLVSDNSLAKEMDGASHAAWSDTANNMANFNLNDL